MALIDFDPEDGRYISTCALCGKVLSSPIFATSHFIGDTAHEFYRFSDSAMHWDCYANWPNQARFAELYFDACSPVDEASNPNWPVLLKSLNVVVTFGVVPDVVSITLRKTGSAIRVKRLAWPEWLMEKWSDSCSHPLEKNAVQEVLEELRQIILPPFDPTKVKSIEQMLAEMMSQRARKNRKE